MPLGAHIGFWDVALVLAVSAQCTLIAYLPQPERKALLLSLPVPSTLATLALGVPVNVTHVAAGAVLLAYTDAVWLLHARLRAPIVPAIALSALGYCAAGALLSRVLPQTSEAFWLAAGAVMALSLALFVLTPPRDEPPHRSPLPIWLKPPIIVAVIVALVLIKNTLGGFMTVFPMVGVVTAYEARHSLWTISRHIPAFLLAFVPMVTAVRLAQGALGLGPALLVGWAVFLAVLVPVLRSRRARDARRIEVARDRPDAAQSPKEGGPEAGEPRPCRRNGRSEGAG